MSCLLPTDCLNEIFEHLEDDKLTLYSCLLVNRLYCKIVIRILWRNVWNIPYNVYYKPYYRTHIPLTIISTLFACLPNESKEFLYNNGIFINTPTQKTSLFSYASFCKVLSIHKINQMIQYVLENQQQQSINSESLNYNKYLLLQEILKMFMNQISSLKSLNYYSGYSKDIRNSIICFPRTKNCLKDLTELNCSSDIYSGFFYQISQICHNIKSLTIDFRVVLSDGLTDLISLQNNLKSLTLKSENYHNGMEITTSSLIKSSLTLTKLKIIQYYTSLSFISMFTNLQELILSFDINNSFIDFNQYITFSQLRVLKFLFACPRVETLIKFFEINGKNLIEFYVGDNNNSINLAIAKFCPNLKILFTIFEGNELETLKVILNSCQYLENIRVWCNDGYLNDKEFLDVLVKHSPKNFYELEIYYCAPSEILPDELEKFFISWKNRVSQKSLSLTIFKDSDNSIVLNVENIKIINKYMKMGLIKKFITKNYDYDDDDDDD